MNKIRSLREKKGLTLARLGELTGISAQQLNRLEKAERRLNEDNLRAIAAALGCRPHDLIGAGSGSGLISVPIMGSVETSTGGRVQASKTSYALELKPGTKFKNAHLTGYVVEGDFHKQYPDGSELIFAELNPALAANLKDGSTVLATVDEGGKQTEMMATLRVLRDAITLEFEGKDFRSSLQTVYLAPERKAAGLSERFSAFKDSKTTLPDIPLKSGNIKLTAILVKSIKAEI